MCLQCSCESISYGDPFPGWGLHRATKDDQGSNPRWMKGEWGLIRCNDPDLTWNGELVKDPFFGWTDDQIDSAPQDIQDEHDRFRNAVCNLDKNIYMHPLAGSELIEACKKRGFNPDSDSVSAWLVHYLARWVELNPFLNHNET